MLIEDRGGVGMVITGMSELRYTKLTAHVPVK